MAAYCDGERSGGDGEWARAKEREGKKRDWKSGVRGKKMDVSEG